MRRTPRHYLLGGVALGAALAGAILVTIAVLLVDDGSPTSPSAATGDMTAVTSPVAAEPVSGAPVLDEDAPGAVVYQEHCARCHEDGAVEPGTPLRELELPIENDIRLVVINGADMMPGFEDTLTPSQIEAVVRYVLDGL